MNKKVWCFVIFVKLLRYKKYKTLLDVLLKENDQLQGAR